MSQIVSAGGEDERRRFVLIFFLDGVGLGSADPAVNPFAAARTPNFAQLLGRDDWYLDHGAPISSPRATLVPTDATLDVPGRPQSATGQAAILSGRNISALVGEHFGPKPNEAVAALISEGTLFSEIRAAGKTAALLTPYPQGYFEAIASGRRLYSTVPLAVTLAGWPLFSGADLAAGRAVSPDYTNRAWREQLGQPELEILSYHQAGERIASSARTFDFSFFEHWPSDRHGHRGTLEDAAVHIEMIDEVIGGMLAKWPDERGLLIMTSDHGNLEEKDHRLHTLNPVPTIIVGQEHRELAGRIKNLTDIAAVVRQVLRLEKEHTHK